MARLRLSVAIITRDEAHRIARCLGSVAFADEIVVVDSGSRDGTPDIARRLGATVVCTSDWPGFGLQKNRALDTCRGEWVFSIDADEVVDDTLRHAIVAATRTESPVQGYWVRRRSTFCGRVVRHGDWRNDRVLRLFRREQARFTDDPVHERVQCPPPHGELAGLLLHDSVDSEQDMVEKTHRYARLSAQKLRAQGRRGGLANAAAHGGWTFLRGFVLRGGFLDGRAGWTIARLNALGTYLKYRLIDKD